MQQQQRFVLFLVISAALIFGWSYLFPPQTPQPNKTNDSSAQQTNQNLAQPSSTAPQSTPAANSQTQTETTAAQLTPDNTPPRTLTITTPLYQVKMSSRGAVAMSWIVKKNKDTERDLHSAAGTKQNPQPLELISQEGLKRQPDEAPLRLLTEDAALNAVLAAKNYRLNGVEGEEGDINVNLAGNETKRVDFLLHDDATGLDVTKGMVFSADRYNVGLAIDLKRGGQTLPTKIVIGPSIGDQGISHYSLYSVAPEGVAHVNNSVQRFLAQAIHSGEEGWLWFTSKRPEGADIKKVSGSVQWAGIGDTYFAMVAVPSKPLDGLEFRTAKYEHEANGKKEDRFLTTALVPIPADGSTSELYVGTKDYYLLHSANADISQAMGGRQIDITELINYGFLASIRRPLAIPILSCIRWLNNLTGSYGLSIILFTIFIYSLFFPLKWRSSKSMKKAQKLAPRMKELQQEIKDVQAKGLKQNESKLKELQMEQLRLMKEGNPLGGCLPLLIQMPFLFALYTAITISIDFRQTSFLWIPDLSSAEPYFVHVLPLLMAGSMVVLQLITPAPSADPLQRKMMAVMMPLVMLFVFWSVPAGLVLYWLVGNIVGFGQQFLINYLTKSEDDPEPPETKKAEPRSPKNPPGKLNAARA